MRKRYKSRKKKVNVKLSFYEYLTFLIENSFSNKVDEKNTVEKAVEKLFENNGIPLRHKYYEDGYSDLDECSCLLEYKFDQKINERENYCYWLIQLLWNFRNFYINKDKLPKVLILVDKNNFALLSSSCLFPYLEDKSIEFEEYSASNAPGNNPKLLERFMSDPTITPIYVNINKDFSDEDLFKKIKNLSIDLEESYSIDDDDGLINCNQYFQSMVLKDSTGSNAIDISIFLDLVRETISINREKEVIIYKDEKGVVHDLIIDVKQYDIWKKLFKYDENKEIDIMAKTDILIESSRRRLEGAFFTPSIVTDYMHKLNKEILGKDCYIRMPWWDRTAGTGNLMRGETFTKSFQSDLYPEFVKEIKKYNSNTTVFSMNAYGDIKIPDDKIEIKCPSLYKVLSETKEFGTIDNPPFSEASSINQSFISSTKGSTTNKTSKQMQGEGVTGAKQLYIQMLYLKIQESLRFENIEKYYICQYLNSKFFTKTGYHKFRNYMYENRFRCLKVVLFPSSLFKGTKDSWATAYAIWVRDLKEEPSWNPDVHNHNADILSIVNGKLKKIGEKNLIGVGKKNDIWGWMREEVNKKKEECMVHRLTSPMKLFVKSQKGINKLGNIFSKDYLGYMFDSSKRGETKIFSSIYVVSGVPIIPENFMKCAAGFFITTHSKTDWKTHGDIDLAPDSDHPNYENWNKNCVIYMMFSDQSSLRRNVFTLEKEKIEIIKNEFFPYSVKEMKDLAIKYDYKEMIEDIEKYGKDRYLYEKINEIKDSLWKESIDILNDYREIIDITFNYRKKFSRKYEPYCFDQGWYVIRKILEKHFPQKLEDFEKKLKILEVTLFIEMNKVLED